MTLEQIKQNIQGEWVSIVPEIQSYVRVYLLSYNFLNISCITFNRVDCRVLHASKYVI
ncbi:MAG: hypothetical protein JWR54_2631 [Mucilaginibacter sp.]|nr:hypothetical protein [Mucilaginibacter sp.]